MLLRGLLQSLFGLSADLTGRKVIYMLTLVSSYPGPRSTQRLTLWIRWLKHYFYQPNYVKADVLESPPVFRSPTLNARQGISTVRRPRSHFDGDWISKPLESEGTAYGHWPVSSQLPALSTKPDIRRLSRRWSMMVQPWCFSEASDSSLSIWVLFCPAETHQGSYCCCVCLILSL